MRETVCVRQASADDLEQIVEFCCALALETEGRHLDRPVVRAGVQRALRGQEPCRYFVAESNHQVVGQAMITYEWSDWRAGVFWWMQSVYVRPEFRRQGVLRALYGHLLGLARQEAGVCGLRLYVDRSNQDAMTVYERLGLAPSGHLVYEHDWSDLACAEHDPPISGP